MSFFEDQPPFRQVWREWPPPFQDPGSPEVETFRRDHEERILFHQYLQWQVEEQLEEVQQLPGIRGRRSAFTWTWPWVSTPGGPMPGPTAIF